MTPDIYIVKVKSPVDDAIFSYLLDFVTPEKKDSILNKRKKQDADNSLLGEILAKILIKKRFGIPVAKQDFCYGENGKPYLENYPDIHFNISHSGEYVVCAISDKSVGVDIQKIGEYKIGVAKRVCNEKELLQIEGSNEKAEEFTKIWVMKEAVLKREGTGFAGKDIKNCLIGESVETEKIEDYYIGITK